MALKKPHLITKSEKSELREKLSIIVAIIDDRKLLQNQSSRSLPQPNDLAMINVGNVMVMLIQTILPITKSQRSMEA